MKVKSTIGIFGVGAIGSVVAFELQKGKNRNSLLYYNRSLKSCLRLVRESKAIELPIILESVPYKNHHLDWLIICIKEHQTLDALQDISQLIGPNTKIAVVRNGLKLKEPYLGILQESNILECSIDCPTQPSEQGFYIVFQDPNITVPAGVLASEFEQLFSDSDVIIKQVDDYQTESWKKVCESSALGSILCLSGETCWIFEDDKVIAFYKNILKEAIEVAIADGAKLKSDFESELINKLSRYPKSKGSSMLTDRLNGKQIEIGAKNKLITEIGKSYGITTPLNDIVVALLDKTNKGNQHSY